MIKLYAHPLSTCTRKVLTALAETGTPYELHQVDLTKREHKQAPHVSRQPFGQIPVIDDEGFMLFESRAICRYLSAKNGDKLVPRDLQQRALMDQWSSVEQSNFSPNAMKFIYHYVFKRNQEQAILDAAFQMLEACYAALSKPLEKNTFLVGDQFTIADIGYMPYLEYMRDTPAWAALDKYPLVAAWWERISKRPSWVKISGRG